ncbi:glycosyl transferase group 1 [Catenulispora acidiphila DSM 44928]|uniref:Glycosyl transferase group 1 n=1 Tax=Catenulispora acidiphila (strain DSM 44928 / JCM 14897 / NBRC 102108 / NRRL B-24433 / ID139908) TaxID=479433 RepID=C7QC85_CATAD|nr:glycosyltransferase family 4 protein [Catenulispora acidiphila]ACU74533.1 glycosyl transferase group 1 [Catenulispora acidiphila DSM 44928]
MRVAILNWRDPWQRSAGGAEAFAHEVARGFVARGDTVDFLTSREPGQPRSELHEGIRWLRRGGRWTVYAGVFGRLIRARLRGPAYDFVIDCQNGIPFFSPLAVSRRRTGVAIVVHHVHDEQFATHFSRPLAALGRWLEGPAARQVYRRHTAVAVSESTITAMRTRLRWTGAIELIHNGVATEGFQRLSLPPALPLASASAPRLVAVGRLVRHKRLEHVLHLADDLAETWPGIEIHIIGRGPDESRIREAASRLHHADRVHIHGHLATQAKNHLLQSAWLHLSASQGEGWGLSVLEAAALGVPTVAYDVDGLRDAIRDGVTGWLVPPGDTLADTVSGVLKELDSDPERASEVKGACLAWAARFDWERTRNAMAQLAVRNSRAPGTRTIE